MANSHALYRGGTETAYAGGSALDVKNTGTTYLEVLFPATTTTTVTPTRANIAPGATESFVVAASEPETLTYYPSYYTSPNGNSEINRYIANRRGSTVGVVPIGAAADTSYGKLSSLFASSRFALSGWGSGRYTMKASPSYGNRHWQVDYLLACEGGADAIPAADLKTAVDLNLHLQLVGGGSYADDLNFDGDPIELGAAGSYGEAWCAAGAIPDYIESDCTTIRGTEYLWGLTPYASHRLRSAMDHSLVLAQYCHLYGQTQGFDATWQSYFASVKAALAASFLSQPVNQTTKLFCQWATWPAVTYSANDTVVHTGDLPMVSVFGHNFAAAMEDMCRITGDSTGEAQWAARASAIRDALRDLFDTHGWLPWNTGNFVHLSPEATAYAVWSGILSDIQSVTASDMFASIYSADKAAHPTGAGDLFEFFATARGASRTARKTDDYEAGVAVFPVSFFNGGYPPANTWGQYNNGGYWFFAVGWIAATMWVNNKDIAIEYAAAMAADYNGDSYASYEGIFNDGTKFGQSYVASSASIVSAVSPGTSATMDVAPTLTAVAQNGYVEITSTVPMTGELQRQRVV